MARHGTIECPNCRQLSAARERECARCGAPLHPAPQPARRPGREVPRGHYLVTAAGEAFPLRPDRPFLIGRSRDADLVARSTDVSRRHAQLILSAGDPTPLLQDLEGRHGTFVEGERLEPRGVRRLRDGDRVRLASNTEFFYLQVDPERLEQEIENRGLATLTSQWAVEDIQKRKTTRRVQRLERQQQQGVEAPHPSTLPVKGDLAALPGSQLLALVKEHEFTGDLSFFDGAQRGALWVVSGLPKEGTVGRLKGQEAIEHFATLRQGTFRLRRGFPEDGTFSELPADDLLIELYEARATGVVSLLREDDPSVMIGRLVVSEGICRSAGLARLVGAEALEKIGALRQGRFRFESKPQEELDGRLMTPRGRRETIRQPAPPPGIGDEETPRPRGAP